MSSPSTTSNLTINGKHSPELYVPVRQPVKVNLESADVIHSFYIPAFMVKFDVVPGLDEFVWFSAVDTGSYDIFCAEYCGLRHSYMLSKVIVMPEAKFNQWVETDVEPIAELPQEGESEEERLARVIAVGERLSQVKGCVACHTTDGNVLIGPSFKGLFGETTKVVTDGQTREVVVDEAYIRRSILDPSADLVEGFQPLMPSQKGLMSDEEIDAIIEYIKALH